MTPSAPPPGSEQLLAVACPTCFGAVAVTSDLFGRAADCPLCGGGFNVPLKAAPAPPPAARGPAAKGMPSATDDATAPARESPDAAAAATSPAVATSPAAAATDHARDAVADSLHSMPAPAEAPTAATTLAGGPPAATVNAELAFHEPVVTVGSGDNVIELRRLTPEEKALRRTRRNLVMLLTGVSILMAIVLSLGRSRRR